MVSGSAKVTGWESWKTLVSVTAYHSFGGEVEARTTPPIRRLTSSCRHQLSPIARVRVGDVDFRDVVDGRLGLSMKALDGNCTKSKTRNHCQRNCVMRFHGSCSPCLFARKVSLPEVGACAH